METSLYNDQLAGQLVNSGYSWVAICLVLLQVVVIPVTIFLWRRYESRINEAAAANKALIDKETELRVHKRNAQYTELENRIKNVERDTNHKMEEINVTVSNMNKTLERFFTRFDHVSEKIEAVWVSHNIFKEQRAKGQEYF